MLLTECKFMHAKNKIFYWKHEKYYKTCYYKVNTMFYIKIKM